MLVFSLQTLRSGTQSPPQRGCWPRGRPEIPRLVQTLLSPAGSQLAPLSMQFGYRCLGVPTAESFHMESNGFILPFLHPALLHAPGWLGRGMVTTCNPSPCGLINSLPPRQQLPNRLSEQRRWLTGLCGATARSAVFASTISLVFQPNPIPANPACSPQGHTGMPQNHPSLSGDAPRHLGWAELIPPTWCPRRASRPFLQTCCPTPLEGSRFINTRHGLIALTARGFLV